MIAAIYARKSTEQNTGDEEKSVTRQIAHARAYAARKGWTVAEAPDAEGRRLHVVRQINDEQAAVVRRIYALCAEGLGFTRIAKALNEDQVAPPRHSSGWAPTAIREILRRPLYRGEVVWNRKRKRDQWGVKRYLDRPEAEWLQLDAPELRIVP